MKAMILAAGKGQRLAPLTDTCPKPLIPIQDKPLIVYHIERLVQAGIQDIVINVWHLANQIQSYLGNGQQFGVRLHYSVEPVLLEVGGGICYALPYLGPEPFWVINADIWTDYPLALLPTTLTSLGHFVLVDNPVDHPQGDFCLDAQGTMHPLAGRQGFTYSGMALLDPALFHGWQRGNAFKLIEVLQAPLGQGQLEGQVYKGTWFDIGTPARLDRLKRFLTGERH